MFARITQTVGDSSCICTPQSHSPRDCAAGEENLFQLALTTVRGIDAEAIVISLASPFPEPRIPLRILSETDDSAAQAHMPILSEIGEEEGVSLTFSVPPPRHSRELTPIL